MDLAWDCRCCICWMGNGGSGTYPSGCTIYLVGQRSHSHANYDSSIQFCMLSPMPYIGNHSVHLSCLVLLINFAGLPFMIVIARLQFKSVQVENGVLVDSFYLINMDW